MKLNTNATYYKILKDILYYDSTQETILNKDILKDVHDIENTIMALSKLYGYTSPSDYFELKIVYLLLLIYNKYDILKYEYYIKRYYNIYNIKLDSYDLYDIKLKGGDLIQFLQELDGKSSFEVDE